MSFRIASLCSGYEGLGMAVQAVLGGELAYVADNDPGAAKILAHRFPDVPNLGDITAVDWAALEPVDLLCAGFPCQDVSCAGARAGLRAGNRTGVWAHVARAIAALRPSIVVLENVRGLLSAGADSNVEPCPWCMGETGDEHALRAAGAVLGDLADLGYDAEWATVSAADAGAPHRRERVFIVARPAAYADDGQPHQPACTDRTPDERAAAGRSVVRTRGRAAADTECGELQRRRVPGLPGSTAAGESCQGRQREWAGDAAGDSGPEAFAYPHGTASGERRQPAPGQAEGGRPRADAGRRGEAPAANASGAGFRGSEDAGPGGRDAGTGLRSIEPQRNSSKRAGAPADTERGACDGRPDEPVGGPDRRATASGDREVDLEWGPYAPAVTRWEHVTGRSAPRPTEPGRTGERLSPAFVEFLMGLPAGWVTDVPGLSRNAQLKALGNGVVPQQAAMALRLLLGAIERSEVAA